MKPVAVAVVVAGLFLGDFFGGVPPQGKPVGVAVVAARGVAGCVAMPNRFADGFDGVLSAVDCVAGWLNILSGLDGAATGFEVPAPPKLEVAAVVAGGKAVEGVGAVGFDASVPMKPNGEELSAGFDGLKPVMTRFRPAVPSSSEDAARFVPVLATV